MKRLITIITFHLIVTNLSSQSTYLWSRDFNTNLEFYFIDQPTIKSFNDTIQVVGVINTANGQRLLMVKYNLNGDTISTNIYGNDSLLNNLIIDYKFDEENQLYILNSEEVSYNKERIIVQKYTSDASLLWMKIAESSSDTSYFADKLSSSINFVNDSNIFITAYKSFNYPLDPFGDINNTQSIAFIQNINSDGSYLWRREFDTDTLFGFHKSLFVLNNSIYVFNNNGNQLVRIDVNNNIQINNNLGLMILPGNVQMYDEASILTTAFSSRYLVAKADLNGNAIWIYDHGSNVPENTSSDKISSTLIDSLGNVYITGNHWGENYFALNGTRIDMVTVKIDNQGNLVWANRYNYSGNSTDFAYCMEIKDDYVYVGGGSSEPNILVDYNLNYVVIKINNSTGITEGEYRYNGIENGFDAVSSLSVMNDGKVALTGLSFMNSNYNWTTQLLEDIILSTPKETLDNNSNIYPNPNNSSVLNLSGEGIEEYQILSSIGQIIQKGTLESKNNKNSIQLNGILRGVYLIHLITDKGLIIKKLIVN